MKTCNKLYIVEFPQYCKSYLKVLWLFPKTHFNSVWGLLKWKIQFEILCSNTAPSITEGIDTCETKHNKCYFWLTLNINMYTNCLSDATAHSLLSKDHCLTPAGSLITTQVIWLFTYSNVTLYVEFSGGKSVKCFTPNRLAPNLVKNNLWRTYKSKRHAPMWKAHICDANIATPHSDNKYQES